MLDENYGLSNKNLKNHYKMLSKEDKGNIWQNGIAFMFIDFIKDFQTKLLNDLNKKDCELFYKLNYDSPLELIALLFEHKEELI